MRNTLHARGTGRYTAQAMKSVTRGHGLLEYFLAKRRAEKALSLIEAKLFDGRVLDVGCGSFPLFLSLAPFKEKIGMDQTVDVGEQLSKNITLIRHDLDIDPTLPFPDNHCDIVTMLAVLEHIEADKLPAVLSEIRRVLKPGGAFILTTPASWTDPLLWMMSKLWLLSADEVEEHQETHTHTSIRTALLEAGFLDKDIAQGIFECGMNLWAKARKQQAR